jgi:hypothetical protein
MSSQTLIRYWNHSANPLDRHTRVRGHRLGSDRHRAAEHYQQAQQHLIAHELIEPADTGRSLAAPRTAGQLLQHSIIVSAAGRSVLSSLRLTQTGCGLAWIQLPRAENLLLTLKHRSIGVRDAKSRLPLETEPVLVPSMSRQLVVPMQIVVWPLTRPMNLRKVEFVHAADAR